MRTLLFLSVSLLASATSFASANNNALGDDTLVPVSNMKLNVQFGCGQPPPDGSPCSAPTVLAMDFIVPAGGSCHTYKAMVRRVRGEIHTLMITDTAIPQCTRPEILNYNVQMSIEIPHPISTIHVINPTSITAMPRP